VGRTREDVDENSIISIHNSRHAYRRVKCKPSFTGHRTHVNPCFENILYYAGFLKQLTSAIEGGLLVSIISFISYALGLSLPMALTAAVVVASKNPVQKLRRRTSSSFKMLMGFLLIVAALYVFIKG